ncbi:MAG: hypothetical protein K5785_00985 [Nitrosarchaeum sp.]|nr:hypothetical protein [Nitrosarchaeum sp.]
MTIETSYLVGDPEPFDETLRYYFSSNWDDSKTNDVTPVFLSPHGKDSEAANLAKEISQADIKGLKAKALILFETTENRLDLQRSSAGKLRNGKASVVQITIYSRTKHEGFLFAEQINDIIQDNYPNTATRIKKSGGSQDSAIVSFEEKGVTFSEPLVQDKEGLVYVSSGFLTCQWQKVKTS